MKISQNHQVGNGTAETGEETLRVIANLPVPEGLVDRVQTRLRNAPHSARILSWPLVFGAGGWGYERAMRGAAAAAIVCVVAGGGWRIYSHVQPAPSAKVLVMPAPASPSRGFSTAGSVHTPDPRPVLTRQAEPKPQASPAVRRSRDQVKNHGKGQKNAPAQANSPQ